MYRLINIQQKLKAPKNQKNTFGGYNFRSCEDILEAVKPLLAEQKLALILSDEVINIDGGFDITDKDKAMTTSNRVYVKATARLFDETGKELISTSALAREEETKKGMDYAQLTGATSSYARKYALNGLFAIDDTKDADATNTHDKEVKTISKPKPVEVNPDLDILEGIKAVSDISNLEKYYRANKDKVKDITAYNKAVNKQKDLIMKGNK